MFVNFFVPQLLFLLHIIHVLDIFSSSHQKTVTTCYTISRISDIWQSGASWLNHVRLTMAQTWGTVMQYQIIILLVFC